MSRQKKCTDILTERFTRFIWSTVVFLKKIKYFKNVFQCGINGKYFLIILCLNICFECFIFEGSLYFNLGCPPQGSCFDSHGGKALPMPHLRYTLPPSADAKEPPAHPHWRKALLRESGANTTCQAQAANSTSVSIRSGFWGLTCRCLFVFQCEKCDLHFRHKSQLRLHLRQKHGAITNTKIRYKVLTEPFQSLLQACWRSTLSQRRSLPHQTLHQMIYTRKFDNKNIFSLRLEMVKWQVFLFLENVG